MDTVTRPHAASVARDAAASELQPQSTRRFVEEPASADFQDQSHQTTLRTEIYTSEDEGEMMNYYTYLSTFKKPIIDGAPRPLTVRRSARSDEDRKDSSERVATEQTLT